MNLPVNQRGNAPYNQGAVLHVSASAKFPSRVKNLSKIDFQGFNPVAEEMTLVGGLISNLYLPTKHSCFRVKLLLFF